MNSILSILQTIHRLEHRLQQETHFLIGPKHGTRISCFWLLEDFSFSMGHPCNRCLPTTLGNSSPEMTFLWVVRILDLIAWFSLTSAKYSCTCIWTEALVRSCTTNSSYRIGIFNANERFLYQLCQWPQPWLYVVISWREPHPYLISPLITLAQWPAYKSGTRSVLQLIRNNITLVNDGQFMWCHRQYHTYLLPLMLNRLGSGKNKLH